MKTYFVNSTERSPLPSDIFCNILAGASRAEIREEERCTNTVRFLQLGNGNLFRIQGLDYPGCIQAERRPLTAAEASAPGARELRIGEYYSGGVIIVDEHDNPLWMYKPGVLYSTPPTEPMPVTPERIELAVREAIHSRMLYPEMDEAMRRLPPEYTRTARSVYDEAIRLRPAPGALQDHAVGFQWMADCERLSDVDRIRELNWRIKQQERAA